MSRSSAVLFATLVAALALMVLGFAPRATEAASHREAPLISNDPQLIQESIARES